MFGKRLNETRKANCKTAQQVADKLKIKVRTYRMYESGDRQPQIGKLVEIADLLDVSIDYLLGRDAFLQSHGVSFDG
jgi:transcriptional regulator with XRE-family HTH domain